MLYIVWFNNVSGVYIICHNPQGLHIDGELVWP